MITKEDQIKTIFQEYDYKIVDMVKEYYQNIATERYRVYVEPDRIITLGFLNAVKRRLLCDEINVIGNRITIQNDCIYIYK